MNICLFGSSFNPPHIAHMQIVEYLKKLNFDKVILVPTGNPNHKKIDIKLTDRIDLVKAFASECQVEVSYHEIENSFEYTVESLEYLNFKSDDNIYFTIGADSLNTLPTWDYFEKLKEMVSFVIFNRQGVELNQDVLKQISYQLIDFTPTDVSSTELRINLQQQLLPKSVYEIIKSRNLYVKHEEDDVPN